MYVKYFARRQVCPSTCTTTVVHISVYQTKEWSEVVCQILSSLSQWPYGNIFHCTHRHKSAANTTTKHPHTPNSSQTVTVINVTEPSWELQISLQSKPVDKFYTTASIIHGHRHNEEINVVLKKRYNDTITKLCETGHIIMLILYYIGPIQYFQSLF